MELRECKDPIGDNDLYLKEIGAICHKIIFAWGNFTIAKGRDRQVIKMFPKGEILAINQNNSPRHPLYVKSDIIPIPFILN